MGKNKFLAVVTSILVLLIGLGSLSACTPTTTSTPANVITLKSVTALPREEPVLAGFKAFMDKVKELSKGEIVIDYMGGPEVMGPFDIGMAVKKGVVDIGYLFSAAYEGMVPAVTYMSVSLLNAEQEREAGVTEFMAKVHEPYGLLYIGRVAECDLGPGSIFYIWTTNKNITKPADMAGLKVAGISPQSDRFIAALGGTSIVLPFPEVYPALQQGVSNALWEGATTPMADGSYKLLKYQVDHSYMMDNHAMIMNPDSWKRLPKRLQDVFMEAVRWTEHNSLDIMRPIYEGARSAYKGAGMQFLRFSPSDAEQYRRTAYEAEWAYLVNKFPDIAPKLKEMVYTGKPLPPEPVYK